MEYPIFFPIFTGSSRVPSWQNSHFSLFSRSWMQLITWRSLSTRAPRLPGCFGNRSNRYRPLEKGILEQRILSEIPSGSWEFIPGGFHAWKCPRWGWMELGANLGWWNGVKIQIFCSPDSHPERVDQDKIRERCSQTGQTSRKAAFPWAKVWKFQVLDAAFPVISG